MPKPAELVRTLLLVVNPRAFQGPKSLEDSLGKWPILQFGRFGHSWCDTRPMALYHVFVRVLHQNVHCRVSLPEKETFLAPTEAQVTVPFFMGIHI